MKYSACNIVAYLFKPKTIVGLVHKKILQMMVVNWFIIKIPTKNILKNIK